MTAITPALPQSIIAAIPPPPPGASGRRLAAWDYRAFLELDSLDGSPGEARKLIRKRLAWWGLIDLLDDTELIATELLTNSIAATRKIGWTGNIPPVRFWLLGGDKGTAVIVWDAVPDEPVRRVPGRHDESGRGIGIIEELSSEWDFYFPPHPYWGKVTRAFIQQ
jgi:hypothetical protein